MRIFLGDELIDHGQHAHISFHEPLDAESAPMFSRTSRDFSASD